MSQAELSTGGFPSPAPPPLTTTDGLIHQFRVHSRIEATIPGKSILVMRQRGTWNCDRSDHCSVVCSLSICPKRGDMGDDRRPGFLE